MTVLDAMYTLGLVVVAAAFAAQVVSYVLIARASLALRSAVGRRYRFGEFLGLTFRSIIPGQQWLDAVDPADAGFFRTYRRRMRVALAFLAVPIVLAALATVAAHV
jgi:hypothetical protein